MTTTTIIEERVIEDRNFGSYMGERRHRVSWGALFAGTIVALATWILLYAIGLAVGLSSVDPQDMSSARVAGIGTGIYSILAPLIALFVGGVVAARLAGLRNHKDGALHGVVVWGLTTIAGLFLIGSLLSNIVGGIVGMGKTAVSSAATAASGQQGGGQQGGGGGPLAALGLDYNALLAPVNQRLQAQGMPPVTADQLGASLQDVLPAMIATGNFNRDTLVGAVAQNTAMSRAEAEQIAAQVQARAIEARERVAATATSSALQVADTTGKAFWAISAALALGLASAAAGGAVGTPSAKRRRREQEVVSQRPVTAGGPNYVP